MCTNVELSTCSCTYTYMVTVMKNATRRWNAITRAQAIAGWWGPIGILSVPNLTLAQLKDSGHIWHHILQKYSNSYWKLAFGSSWIGALVVYFWPRSSAINRMDVQCTIIVQCTMCNCLQWIALYWLGLGFLNVWLWSVTLYGWQALELSVKELVNLPGSGKL